MNTKNFSLLLPTRDRPVLVKRMINSMVETTSDIKNLELIVFVNDDDTESQDISHPLVSITKITGEKDTMGGMNRRCYKASRGNYIMLVNDDMLFRTKNWDKEALAKFSDFSDGIGMVYGNDLYYGKRVCTFPILSRTTWELTDRICPYEFKMHCIDSHIFDIFQRLSILGEKRITYLPNVIFEHMHYELSASLDEPESPVKNSEEDEALFFSLAEERQRIAMKMFEYIKNKKQEIAL
jgi:hypothetical protein